MTSDDESSVRPALLRAKMIQLLRRVPLVGSALRWYARKYVEGSVVTIKSGYARGLRWRRHHKYVSGYWLGQYELTMQRVLVRKLRPGSVFFDVGAHGGFFTVIAASRVGPAGKCVAFDPDQENITSIREQCDLNGFSSVVVVNAAISDVVGRGWFARSHPGAATGHLSERSAGEESIDVATTTLDAAAAVYGVPSVVKIDIEGGETRALKGAARLLMEHRPMWLVEIHDPASEADVNAIFLAARYGLSSLNGKGLSDDAMFPKHILAHPEEKCD